MGDPMNFWGCSQGRYGCSFLIDRGYFAIRAVDGLIVELGMVSYIDQLWRVS